LTRECGDRQGGSRWPVCGGDGGGLRDGAARGAGRGGCSSQSDGAVGRASQQRLPAEGGGSGASAYPRRAVRRVVGAVGVAS
jgi:hypothetical protein